MPDTRKHWLDRPANVTKLLWAFYVLCAVMIGVELVIHRHEEFSLEGSVGFYAIYGFIGIVLLVLAARELRRLVGRPEDYYDA